MSDIDYILDLFDWNQSIENQAKGLELAKNVKSINAFLQPGDEKHNKNVWDNCAKTLAEREDAVLKPYLYHLFGWLIDMNWPGAQIVFDRLEKYQDKEWFNIVLDMRIKQAKLLDEQIWLENLLVI